ncbi:transglutaminase family protein [Martelella alba]|uniref:Transglutaminase family protein n=1 Tax=Martelella alba TaxID=2590451 RepID=A0A506UB61_9HYPH|nr:transglutaminase family protein [Martelella alba]TPW31642.1 transglutaminase family protein [Martelella alba]
MFLKINHVTEYRYEEPVVFSLQRLRLTPVNSAGQTVVDWSVAIEGAKNEVTYSDQYENLVRLVSVDGEQSAMRLIATGTVETRDTDGIFGPHSSDCPLWLFLRETPLTEIGKHTRAIVSSLEGDSDLARLHDLMGRLYEKMTFKPGITSTTTSAEEALEHEAGVCQDYAHIVLACARQMKLPARYVSGYLFMEGTTDQSASHAWAEIYLEGLGWVGFDAANKVCPDERYVRIACGLDYTDAAPVVGMTLGGGPGQMSVNLQVISQNQSQSQSQS